MTVKAIPLPPQNSQPTNGAKLSESAQISPVKVAAVKCHRDATADENTAQRLAKNALTGAPGAAVSVPATNTKRDATAKSCDFCGAEFHPTFPTRARFCGSACRRRQWLKDNPSRAAEIAASDKARLRAHFEQRGKVWQE